MIFRENRCVKIGYLPRGYFTIQASLGNSRMLIAPEFSRYSGLFLLSCSSGCSGYAARMPFIDAIHALLATYVIPWLRDAFGSM